MNQVCVIIETPGNYAQSSLAARLSANNLALTIAYDVASSAGQITVTHLGTWRTIHVALLGEPPTECLLDWLISYAIEEVIKLC